MPDDFDSPAEGCSEPPRISTGTLGQARCGLRGCGCALGAKNVCDACGCDAQACATCCCRSPWASVPLLLLPCFSQTCKRMKQMIEEDSNSWEVCLGCQWFALWGQAGHPFTFVTLHEVEHTTASWKPNQSHFKCTAKHGMRCDGGHTICGDTRRNVAELSGPSQQRTHQT